MVSTNSVEDGSDATASAVHDSAVHDAAERRTGTIAGVAAYSLWGLFPLVFHQLESVGAGEILIHRIVWSFVVVLVILWFRRHRQQGAIAWLR